MNKKSEVFDSAKYPGFPKVDSKKRVFIPVDEGRFFIQKNKLEQNHPSQLTIIPNEWGHTLLAMLDSQYKSLLQNLSAQNRKLFDLICPLTVHSNLEIVYKSKGSDRAEGVEEIHTLRLGPLSELYNFGLIEPEERLKIVCLPHGNGFCLQIYPAHFEKGKFKHFSDLRKRIEDVCRFYKFD